MTSFSKAVRLVTPQTYLICRGSHDLGLEEPGEVWWPSNAAGDAFSFLIYNSVWWYLPTKRFVILTFEGTFRIWVERRINIRRCDFQMLPETLILQRFPKCYPTSPQMIAKCFPDCSHMASRSLQMSPPRLWLHDVSSTIVAPWFLLHGSFSMFSLQDSFSMISPQDSSSIIPYPWILLKIPSSWLLLHEFSHDSSPMIPRRQFARKIPSPWFLFYKSFSMIPPWCLLKDRSSMTFSS